MKAIWDSLLPSRKIGRRIDKPIIRIVRAATMMLIVLTSLAGSDAIAQSQSGRHCVVELAADGQGRIGPARCYTDPEQALADATGRSVPAGLNPGSASVDEWILSSNASGLQGTVLSREFDGQDYSGSSLYYTTSNPHGCLDGTNYQDPELNAWNNRIESVRAYAGCSVRHYDYYNFGGSSITCSSNCSSLGGMNNDTSSITHN